MGDVQFLPAADREPHAVRRRAILEKHPHIRELVGPEPVSKYVCGCLILAQLALSVWSAQLSWCGWCALCYCVGATLAQALFLAIHELSHNLFFRAPWSNRCFAIMANLPLCVPFCVSFRHYHLEHHAHQGVEGIDMDLPSLVERRAVRGGLAKFVWLAGQLVAYALRPVLTAPPRLSAELAVNCAAQLAFDALLWRFHGAGPLLFLATSALLAGGLHPTAGHFLSEHYVFEASPGTPPQETFSYYGPLNRVTWNVGFHNEHHDFPRIPWSRLPLVRATAPEFYVGLQHHTSWMRLQAKFLTEPGLHLGRRAKRSAAP